MGMYEVLAGMLNRKVWGDSKLFKRLAYELKNIILYAAFEDVHADLTSMAIWKRPHPQTGELYNYLRLHGLTILLSNNDIGLLRCLLLRYDENKEPDSEEERKKLKPLLRFKVLARDKYTCQVCGKSPPEIALHVDHIIPISLGGETIESNLHTLCDTCNLGKSDAFCPELVKPEYLTIPPPDSFWTSWDGYLLSVRDLIADIEW